jgi:hypothetical protein
MDVLDQAQTAVENVARVIDAHGDCSTGGPGTGEDGEDEPIYDLEIAREALHEIEAVLESPCECWNGVLWPWGTDSDRSHDWIERCDECATYESDDAAALALADRLGCSLTFSTHPTLNRLAPHIDLPR